jgi:hypothetical protein
MRLFGGVKVAVVVCLLMAAAAVNASAQGIRPLQGTYVMNGQNVGNPGVFTNLIQFDKDGGVREMAPGPLPPNVYVSPGLGQWVRTGPNEFTVKVWFVVVAGDLNQSGLFGFFKQEFKLSYNANGTDLGGPFNFALVDANDHVIFGGSANLLLKPIS